MNEGAYIVKKIRDRCIDDAGCLVWKGYCQNGKTPIINLSGGPQTVRRLMYSLEVGEVLPTHEVITTCESARCVLPEHLKMISKAERRAIIGQNNRKSAARIAANRERQGKLTMEKAREIRASDESNKDIAARFGVTPQLISLVRSGRSWAEPSPFAGLGAR